MQNAPATIDAMIFPSSSVIVRNAASEKTNEAKPAKPDNRALLIFCAVPSLLPEIGGPLAVARARAKPARLATDRC
jgi:hypothetical protein